MQVCIVVMVDGVHAGFQFFLDHGYWFIGQAGQQVKMVQVYGFRPYDFGFMQVNGLADSRFQAKSLMVECLKVFGGGGFKQVVNSFFFEVVCVITVFLAYV